MMMWNHFIIVDLCKWFQFQLRRKETDILHFCIRYSIHFCVQLFRFSFLWEIRYCTWKDGKCIASYGELVFRAPRKSSLQWPPSYCASSEKQQVKWNQCQKLHCIVQCILKNLHQHTNEAGYEMIWHCAIFALQRQPVLSLSTALGSMRQWRVHI